jgi:hypothetical protein
MAGDVGSIGRHPKAEWEATKRLTCAFPWLFFREKSETTGQNRPDR